jgi:hypothetical protein
MFGVQSAAQLLWISDFNLSNWHMPSMRQTRKSGRIWKWHARHRKNERVCFESFASSADGFLGSSWLLILGQKKYSRRANLDCRQVAEFMNYFSTYETMIDRLTLQPAADSAFALWQGKCTPFRGFLCFAKVENRKRLKCTDIWRGF